MARSHGLPARVRTLSIGGAPSARVCEGLDEGLGEAKPALLKGLAGLERPVQLEPCAALRGLARRDLVTVRDVGAALNPR